MSNRNAVAALVLTVLAGPLGADIPDGQGGRTSLQASKRPAATSPHACCPRVSTRTATLPSSAAEVKAIGEVAWMSRHAVTETDLVPCYKMAETAAPTFASSAELKALGHLSRRPAAGAADGQQRCCTDGSCPMRRTS